MDPKNYKIYMYATLIMITVLLCMEMAWGCVDCDLNKKAFEKKPEVMEIEWHNPDGTIPVSYTHLTLPTICSV